MQNPGITLSVRISSFIIQQIDIRSFVRGKKKWSEMSTERFKNVTSFVINLLNNKTIILLNLAEYRLILADSAYGLAG